MASIVSRMERYQENTGKGLVPVEDPTQSSSDLYWLSVALFWVVMFLALISK